MKPIFIFTILAALPALARAQVINCYGVDVTGIYIQVLGVGDPAGTRILGYERNSNEPSKMGLKLERNVKLTRANSADINADPVYVRPYPNLEVSGHYEVTVSIPKAKTSGTGKLVDFGRGTASVPYRFEYSLTCALN